MEPQMRLPLPDIRDDALQHSFKQAYRRDDSNKLRPPKLKPRYHHDSNYNRSHSSASTSTTPLAISFRGDGGEVEDNSADISRLSASYDPSNNETYFEQCFTQLGKLGEGSFGEVFKVRCKEDGLLYAVKMSKQLFRSEQYRQERLEEVRRYEQFSGQANCVRFYRAWEQKDRLYMQMELCRENLEHYLERRRSIPEEKIWSILLDLLLALKSLHDRNLIHLDIKLDNVLIDDDDSCKLADFGLVIDVDRANRHQATEGDSRYMAPEIMQGKFSKAADIFSLGIAMLELCCCLELPSNGPLWQQLRSGVLPLEFTTTISLEFQEIIKQMMSPDPHSRPTVDQLLEHKKLAGLLRRRKRWELICKMNHTIRKTRRLVLSKVCNLGYIIFRFLTYLVGSLKFRDPNYADAHERPQADKQSETSVQGVSTLKVPTITAQIVSSTPTRDKRKDGSCSDFLLSDKYLDFSQQGTPSNFAIDNVVNSTPVNHFQHSFRSRKDLTKTSFKTLESNSPSIIDKPGILPLDDIETHSHSFTRKPLDMSSLRAKKLFVLSDDSD